VIKTEWPPNIEQIAAAFPHVVRARLPAEHPDHVQGILFAYGEDIYNPHKVWIPKALYVHEIRHCARQFAIGAASWWEQYIADQDFRYAEEAIAHADEYKAQLTGDRNARARLSMRTAQRLVADLYNYDPPRSLKQAMGDIEALV
jgi:hypothetical protein